MERREQIKVKSGAEYDHLFPRAMLKTITKKEGATVADTIRFIPQVVNETLFHTEKIAQVLKAGTVQQTCNNIWQFVYEHIAYKKDKEGKEQVRSPARAWHDRHRGVDCDCYTVFISSILSNLNIPHLLRITKYQEDRFQHIYPVVPLKDGSYITIDCVVKQFNYEEPYREKKDTTMDLEYLNGVGDPGINKIKSSAYINDFDDREAMAELGKLFNRKSGGEKKKGKIKEALKKGVHSVNKFNPATALLRAGVLASAKLNVLKVSQRLKYAYLSDEEARKRNVDMGKFSRLKAVREKLDKIFYGAGGDPINLKKAILTGRGNKNHDVSGLGYTSDLMEGVTEESSMSTLLGTAIYQNEIDGLGELGEPATATAIAAASGVMGAIAGILKSIGSIFPKQEKASEDFENVEAGGATTDAGTETDAGTDTSDPASTEDTGSDESQEPANNNNQLVAKKSNPPPANKKAPATKPTKTADKKPSSAPTKPVKKKTPAPSEDKPPESFWEKNKKWIKPVGIGAGALGLLYAGYRILTGKKKEAPVKQALSGIPKSTKKQQKKGGTRAKIKSKKQKKEVITLL